MSKSKERLELERACDDSPTISTPSPVVPIGILILILMCLGEPDLLDALIMRIMP